VLHNYSLHIKDDIQCIRNVCNESKMTMLHSYLCFTYKSD